MSENRRLRMQRNRHSTTPAFIGLDRRLLFHLQTKQFTLLDKPECSSSSCRLTLTSSETHSHAVKHLWRRVLERNSTLSNYDALKDQWENLRSPVWQMLYLHFSKSLHFTLSLATGEANSIGVCDSSCGGKDKTGKRHGSAPEMGTSLGRTSVSRLMTSNGGR